MLKKLKLKPDGLIKTFEGGEKESGVKAFEKQNMSRLLKI